MNNEDMAGRIMAHAFNDEFEKISARVPRRFMKGPNPFKKGTAAHKRVELAREHKTFAQNMGKRRQGATTIQRIATDLLPVPFAGDKRKLMDAAIQARLNRPGKNLRLADQLAASDRRGAMSGLLDKGLGRKQFAFGKTRKGTDTRAHLKAYLAEKKGKK